MLLHEELTGKIIGIFYDVYNELGHGFLESVYQKAMYVALQAEGFTVEQQHTIAVQFRGVQVGEFFADLLVNDVVILELKVARTIDSSHEAQLLHYLKATDCEIGLLLNFGDRPQFRRLIFDNHKKQIRENPCEFVVS
jgi:GxxExxY protein